jgi:hypothetical protein
MNEDQSQEEKTLEEALEEMDQWGDQVVQAIQPLSREAAIEHLRQAQARLEEATGKKLNLRVRGAPQGKQA